VNRVKKIGAVLLAAALSLPQFLSFDVKAATEPIELPFDFVKAYTSNGTFTPTKSGKYKIYAVGQSGNGADCYNKDYSGGGGGSGAIAVSILNLEAGKTYPLSISSAKTSWNNDQLYATAGQDGNGKDGGSGGKAYGGSLYNDDGYKGGNGFTWLTLTAQGTNGENGGNQGMSGGAGGSANVVNFGYGDLSTAGAGGGGGARLPDLHCKYVSSAYTSLYKAGCGGIASSYSSSNGSSADTYPSINTSNIVLYGGGGGGGGKSRGGVKNSSENGAQVGYGGAPSSGTPGVVIIEECTDTTPPIIDSIEFSKDHKSVTITGTDEYGVAGFYVNGEFKSGNPLTYSIPSGTLRLTIQAEDNAGNQSEEQIADVLPAAPGITVTPDKAWLNAVDGKAIVTLSTDAAGIFENVKLWYSLDGGAGWTYFSVPLEISKTCTVTAKVTCTNGDSEPAQKEIHIDSLPPSIVSAVVDESDMENRFLTVTAADSGGSGVKGIWIDNVMWTDNPAVYYIPDGKDTVTLKVEDIAGNLSEPVEQVVRHIDTIPPTIDSVEFTDDLSVMTIRMSDDTYGDGVKGVYINGAFKAGNPVLWAVPEDIAILRLQAEDNNGNKSEIRRERVPGRTTILDTITIESVEFSEDNTTATITAATSEPGTSITGIYCNGELIAGNPVTYTIPVDNSQYLKVQAVNNEGDKSKIVTKRVPGWSEVIDTITIESITFSEDNTTATITAATSEPGTSITGIYCNDELIAGNPVTYTIPADNNQYLKAQAVNSEGDRSEIVTKRVPGWSEVVGTIAVTSVELLNDNKLARVRADTTRLNASILGIYVNSVFYEGNPIECAVTSGTEYLECQAVDDTGDLSQPVVRPIPKETTTGSGGGGHHSSGGSGSTTSISISEPVPQDGQYRVGISAKDSECEIEKIIAVWDGYKEDITKSHFILLDNDTQLQVIAVNSDGRMTYKKVRIRLAGDEPIIEEPVPETPTMVKTNPTAKQEPYSGQTAPTQGSSAGTESDNAQADPREQLEELLRRQQLKHKHKEQPAQAANIQQVIPEPIRRPSGSSNRPGAAAVLASVLCFLALMVLIILLVHRQHKQSSYCEPPIPKKR